MVEKVNSTRVLGGNKTRLNAMTLFVLSWKTVVSESTIARNKLEGLRGRLVRS